MAGLLHLCPRARIWLGRLLITEHGTRPDTPQPTAPGEDRQCHKTTATEVLKLVMVEAPVGREVELPGVVLLVAVGVGRGHHPVLV
jgi:hypothetical protein